MGGAKYPALCRARGERPAKNKLRGLRQILSTGWEVTYFMHFPLPTCTLRVDKDPDREGQLKVLGSLSPLRLAINITILNAVETLRYRAIFLHG